MNLIHYYYGIRTPTALQSEKGSKTLDIISNNFNVKHKQKSWTNSLMPLGW